MRDKVAQHHAHVARDKFIKSISESNICLLASSYHNDDPCTFFKPPTRGSYNICFFVSFHIRTNDASHPSRQACEKSDRWVVRVPLSPYLGIAAHDKLESEVAVMQLISAKTTIPIPKLHAYSLARENGPYGIASFMIIEYIDGKNLNNVGFKTITEDQRQNLYIQLAKIYIQLRRLEFPAIGRLAPSPDGGRVVVSKGPMTNDINVQEVEGLRPFSIMSKYSNETGALTSANAYISMLLRIAWNAFEKGRKNVRDEAEGCDSLYHLDQFSQFVKIKWLNHALDCGPFVLAHGDLQMHNLIVNEDLDILAVLDWEWSQVVPLQLFIPPTWITNRPITSLSWDYIYDVYIKNLDGFRAVVRDQELKMYSDELLSRDWANIHKDAGILIASALESWTLIEYVAGRYLDRFLYRRIDLSSRIQQFMEADPSRTALVSRKVADYAEHQAERKLLGLEDSSDEEEKREVEKVTRGSKQNVKR